VFSSLIIWTTTFCLFKFSRHRLPNMAAQCAGTIKSSKPRAQTLKSKNARLCPSKSQGPASAKCPKFVSNYYTHGHIMRPGNAVLLRFDANKWKFPLWIASTLPPVREHAYLTSSSSFSTLMSSETRCRLFWPTPCHLPLNFSLHDSLPWLFKSGQCHKHNLRVGDMVKQAHERW